MKLTGCSETEFTCKNGECLSIIKRCNQIVDCEDETDEDDCLILDFKGNYKKSTPPIESKENDELRPAYVSISIDFLKMVKTDEVNNKIMIKFTIALEWYEKRVNFNNLKKPASMNTLSLYEVENLWLPFVIFDNTDMVEAVRVEEGVFTEVQVTKEEEGRRSDATSMDEIEIYSGRKNKLTLYQTYSKQFHCKYKLHKYPFHSQVFIVPYPEKPR